MPSSVATLLAALDTTGPQSIGHLRHFRLHSAFQPIYSLSHMRLVGHEALVRAHDENGQPVSPPALFASCADAAELAHCDHLSRLVHLSNHQRQGRQGEWLFLNLHPDVFTRLATEEPRGYLQEVAQHFELAPDNLVLELLESQVQESDAFTEAVTRARQDGALIAIDDFGAGHSNFDRVWRLQPDIVKLDRGLVASGAREPRVRRVVAQMVSLLHECGAMVLMEGIETQEEAMMALECDADLVQGYHFGRPQPALMPSRHTPAALQACYDGLSQKRVQQRQAHREQVAPYLNAIGHAGVLLSAGCGMVEACHGFLSLPGAEFCYVLDARGYQIGKNLWAAQEAPKRANAQGPLDDAHGACWSRRPYFRRAMEAVNRVQITRPYRTMNGRHQCMTASMAFRCVHNGAEEIRVVCGDVRCDEVTPTPTRAP